MIESIKRGLHVEDIGIYTNIVQLQVDMRGIWRYIEVALWDHDRPSEGTEEM